MVSIEALRKLAKTHGRFCPCFLLFGSPLLPKLEKAFSLEGFPPTQYESIELSRDEAACVLALFGQVALAIKTASKYISPENKEEEISQIIGLPPQTVKQYTRRQPTTLPPNSRAQRISKKLLRELVEGNPIAKEEAKCLIR